MTTIVPVVFFAVLGIVIGAYWLLIIGPEARAQQKLRTRVNSSARAAAVRLSLVKDAERLSSVAVVDAVLGHARRVVRPTQLLIEQAGFRTTVGAFFLASGCAAGSAFVIVKWATGHLTPALIVGAAAGLMPFLLARRARTKRAWKFEEQFPEGLDLIARALRAGHTFQAGLMMVSEEIEAPVGTEFRLLHDRQNFGMPISDALRDFAERTPVLDAKFFATAVLTQRDAGGNLAEVLDNLSAVIRERFKVKRQVRVISAHGRITGWVLACLPPALGVGLFIINPEIIRPLFTDPLGIKMFYAAIFLQVTGTLIIRKLVNIEY